MSTDTTHRCAVCLCFLDEEDLFCANCGTENPHVDSTALHQLTTFTDHYSYDCDGCGASMSYDASAQALRCPFCGNEHMKMQEARRSIQCDWVVPLKVDHQGAERIFREWLGRGFWRPSDAVQSSQIGKIAAVYVPFWIFEADADTKWTADSSPAPAGCRGDWYPVSGQNRARHRDILVGASGTLAAAEVDAIAPFDLQQAVKPDEIDLVNAIVEIFRMPRKHARPIAQAIVEERERQICTTYVPGRARRVKVNVRIQGMSGRPVLLPVWILAYHYKNSLHRVLINGQTGKIAGSAPFAYGKLAFIIVALVLIMLVVFALIAVANS
jgi:predicted RNA-binding Zn-ribbon protein involved in translation (DUF1610 family)